MAKKCIMVELSVIVDTDIESVNDIMDALEVSVTPKDELVGVNPLANPQISTEVQNFYECEL